MFSRFYLIPERHGRTDRIAISITRVSVLTRDKNLLIAVCSCLNYQNSSGGYFFGVLCMSMMYCQPMCLCDRWQS